MKWNKIIVQPLLVHLDTNSLVNNTQDINIENWELECNQIILGHVSIVLNINRIEWRILTIKFRSESLNYLPRV